MSLPALQVSFVNVSISPMAMLTSLVTFWIALTAGLIPLVKLLVTPVSISLVTFYISLPAGLISLVAF